METRLALPLLLLVGALTLAAGVERSLERGREPFRVAEGQLVTSLALGGVGGLGPALRWEGAPEDARHFVIVGRDLDAGAALFWLDAGDAHPRRFSAPGLRAALSHRLRVRVYALSEDPGLGRDASPEELAHEASRHALATATWCAGGGWLR